jgi:hypothetical protein
MLIAQGLGLLSRTGPLALRRARAGPVAPVRCALQPWRVARAAPARGAALAVGPGRVGRRSAVSVRAVFEKFTERSIKSVMLAQQEARQMGATEVGSSLLG